MMGWSPECYVPSYVEIGPLVPEKKTLEGFLPYIWVWWPSWSCDQHHVIRFLFCIHLKAFIQNLVQIGTVVSEKIIAVEYVKVTPGSSFEQTTMG